VGRLSSEQHYFGIATIGQVFPDRVSTKGDLFACVEDFAQFDKAVHVRIGGAFLEKIPESRITNYWRDGVRAVDETTYQAIVAGRTLTPIVEDSDPATVIELNDLAGVYESALEGSRELRFVATYERKRALRMQAIAIHGLTCACCRFNFAERYGDYAAGMIHVHHRVPISERGGPVKVDPAKDLVPVCANCHGVIHRRRDRTLSIDEVKAMYRR
jgi:putative restriction endonuclease